MLVLSRHLQEQIMIGNDIVITVMQLPRGPNGQVRLGIEAPPNVAIHRSEVFHEIRREIQEQEMLNALRLRSSDRDNPSSSDVADPERV